LLELGRLEEAQAAFEEAIQEVESMRAQLPGEQQGAIRFLDSHRGVFLHMVQLQLDRQRSEVALEYVERSKARSLLDTLRLGNPAVTQAMTDDEAARERSLAAIWNNCAMPYCASPGGPIRTANAWTKWARNWRMLALNTGRSKAGSMPRIRG
jgi:hypothetical protein